MPERTCGGCTACCFTHSVDMDGVTTGFYSLCVHCTPGTGCAIYDARPRSCRVYKCLWRATDLNETLRPDRSGVVIDTWEFTDVGATFLLLWEVEPGSLERPRMKALVEQLFATQKYILWRIGAEDNTLEFPEHISPNVRARVMDEFKDVINAVSATA